MPSGIVIASGNSKTTKEELEKVLVDNGLEVEKEEIVEPQRDSFANEEEYTEAHAEWAAKQVPEKKEEKREERRPSRRQRIEDRATREANRRIQDLEREVAELRGKKEEAAPKEEPRPKRDEFATQEEYEDALIAWGHKREAAKAAQQTAQQRQQEYVTKVEQGYVDRVADFKDEHEDWDELISKHGDEFIYPEVQWFIKEQENGPEVMYHLVTHLAELRKLAELSPLSAVAEVGRLSAKLKSATEEQAPSSANGGSSEKPKPRVPAPVRPVSTGGAATTASSREVAQRKPYSGQYQDFKRAQRAGR